MTTYMRGLLRNVSTKTAHPLLRWTGATLPVQIFQQIVIYILTNPSFPEYVKIGYAAKLEERLRQLNRSEAIPYAFRAYATYEVESNLTDVVFHDLIDRLNPDLRSIETFAGREQKESSMR